MTLKDHASRLVGAIKRAVEEHGADNSFSFAELEWYGGPNALIAGRAARLYPRELDAVNATVDSGGRIAVK